MTIHTHRVKDGIRRNSRKQKLTEKDRINSGRLQQQPDEAISQMMDNLLLSGTTAGRRPSEASSIKPGHASAKSSGLANQVLHRQPDKAAKGQRGGN